MCALCEFDISAYRKQVKNERIKKPNSNSNNNKIKSPLSVYKTQSNSTTVLFFLVVFADFVLSLSYSRPNQPPSPLSPPSLFSRSFTYQFYHSLPSVLSFFYLLLLLFNSFCLITQVLATVQYFWLRIATVAVIGFNLNWNWMKQQHRNNKLINLSTQYTMMLPLIHFPLFLFCFV